MTGFEQTMETYRPGEVVLLSFPFADASGVRRRPGLVLLDAGDEDVVVARVTSQVARSEYEVEIREWQEAGLLLPSVVRLHKVATLEKRLVERKLGGADSRWLGTGERSPARTVDIRALGKATRHPLTLQGDAGDVGRGEDRWTVVS